ncbi:hypothetical protein ACN28E_31025 [Archangium lansingense]|uniref:hypothetical protein n=1 Tax=Archangium lansingense TaxID=2995310 RepID=UPI003B7B3D44
MSKTDLSRWNRAGLRRFRYVDGNAATFLEELRERLATRFPDWQGVAAPVGESDPARQARILEQYGRARAAEPDWGWEIARVLARASHILAEHLDAYANEGYLRTATQWESLRRLVEMIDYHPSPPASAFTPLVLEARPGARGRVARGFSVRYSPPDGGRPLVFETLEDLEADAGLNMLRPVDHDRSPDLLGGSWLTLAGSISGLVIGEPLVMETESGDTRVAHVISNVIQHTGSTEVQVTPPISARAFTKGRTRVHVKPKDRLAPLGPVQTGAATVGTVLRLKVVPQGLLPGEVVSITDGKVRRYRRVQEVVGKHLQLDRPVGELATGQATVARPVQLAVARQLGQRAIREDPTAVFHFVLVPGDWSRLTGDALADPTIFGQAGPGARRIAEYEVEVMAAVSVPVELSDEEARGHTILRLIQRRGKDEPHFPLVNPQRFLAPPVAAGGWEVDVPLLAGDTASRLSGALRTAQPKSLSAGDLAVVVSGSQASWARLASVAVDTDVQQAELRPDGGWEGRAGGDFFLTETRVYGHFQVAARVEGWDENTTPLSGKEVKLATVPAALRHGRKLLVEQEGGSAAPLLTSVEAVNGDTLVLKDPVPEGSTLGNLVLSGNVVLAGHGERKPEKVLGSGDATQSGQSFVLAERQLSFISDPTQLSGVRADVEVTVAGRTWTQVSTFRGSGPSDPYYTVRMLEDGSVAVVFGDGSAGQRLPTGANNVRISYRVGTGLGGNLPAGSLETPARPHALVAAVRQPIGAVGGNDMEGVETLRYNAPATLLTLERAVAPGDFAHLAMAHSSVWQARATYRPCGTSRHQCIEVVVVPADGGKLGSLGPTLAAYLTAHALPGVDVAVKDYTGKPVHLSVTVEVKSTEFEPDGVARAVQAALLEAFSLRRRGLGQALYLSEVYKVVEAVQGVQSSLCVLEGASHAQRLNADAKSVLYLDPVASRLAVRAQEYSL